MATIRTPDYLVNTSFATNTSGDIGANDVQDHAESSGSIPTQTTALTSYTIALTDRGTLIETTSGSATTVYIPTDASVAFAVGAFVQVTQYGAGALTIAAVTPGTTTIRTPTGTLTARARYSTVGVRKRAANEWVAFGDLS